MISWAAWLSIVGEMKSSVRLLLSKFAGESPSFIPFSLIQRVMNVILLRCSSAFFSPRLNRELMNINIKHPAKALVIVTFTESLLNGPHLSNRMWINSFVNCSLEHLHQKCVVFEIPASSYPRRAPEFVHISVYDDEVSRKPWLISFRNVYNDYSVKFKAFQFRTGILWTVIVFCSWIQNEVHELSQIRLAIKIGRKQ